MNSSITEAIATAKRNCDKCALGRSFKPSSEDREIARKACRRAADEFREEFETKRREENTSNEEIINLRTAKSTCLDALDECETCKKEMPRMKNIINQINF